RRGGRARGAPFFFASPRGPSGRLGRESFWVLPPSAASQLPSRGGEKNWAKENLSNLSNNTPEKAVARSWTPQKRGLFSHEKRRRPSVSQRTCLPKASTTSRPTFARTSARRTSA